MMPATSALRIVSSDPAEPRNQLLYNMLIVSSLSSYDCHMQLFRMAVWFRAQMCPQGRAPPLSGSPGSGSEYVCSGQKLFQLPAFKEV